MAFFDGAFFDSGARFDEVVVPPTQPRKGKTMSKIKLDLKSKTPDAKAALAHTHHTAFAGSPFAAAAVPTQAEIDTAADAMDTALADVAAARAALKNKQELRDQKELALDDLLTRRAKYCEAVSGGDPALLTAWGFNLTSDPEPIGDLPAPLNLLAEMGSGAGTMDLSWKAVRGADSYVVECSSHTVPRTWQQIKIASRPTIVVNSLTSGQTYVFRVAAVGPAGQGPWSDEAVKMAP